MSLATTIAAGVTAFALLRMYLHKIGYFYKGEEGYELECEQEENKSHQNKEARSVKSENINRM